MKQLIVCLGYGLEDDGSVPEILQNRLIDSIRFCRAHRGAALLLMGNRSYRDLTRTLPSQAAAMKKYVELHASDVLHYTEVLTEESTASTVEQICYLRNLLETQFAGVLVSIVASEFFVDRVQLYVEYIFGAPTGVICIVSPVPPALRSELRLIEAKKHLATKSWLARHTKGDYQAILREQLTFLQKVITGQVEHPAA